MQNSTPPLKEETCAMISHFFRGNEEKIKKAVEETAALCIKILTEAEKNNGKTKILDTDSNSWIPLKTKMLWIKKEFEARGYTFQNTIEYERVGEPFIKDEINHLFQNIAHITLKPCS